MNDPLVFGLLPYLAAGSLVLVGAGRLLWLGRGGPPLLVRYAQAKRRFGGTVAWRGGLLAVLLGHAVGFLFPRSVLLWNQVPARLLVLEGTALACGCLLLVGLVQLVRSAARERRASLGGVAAEVAFLSLMLLLVVSGLGIAVELRWGSVWYAATLVPYLKSLVALEPDVAALAEMPWLVRGHIAAAIGAVALLPWTRAVYLAAPLVLAVERLARALRPGLGSGSTETAGSQG